MCEEIKKYVVNIRSQPPEQFDVYIGRPSPYGNPFIIGRHGNRNQVVSKYRRWLLAQPELVRQVKRELAGKRLGCFCAPYSCHGDVLAEIANELL